MVAEAQRLLLARKLSSLNPMQIPKMAVHLQLLFVVTMVRFQGKEQGL